MEVEVHLFANYGPPGARGGPARLEVPDGATVRELLGRLRIPDEPAPLLLVNGQEVDPAARLRAGDVVAVLPPLAGG